MAKKYLAYCKGNSRPGVPCSNISLRHWTKTLDTREAAQSAIDKHKQSNPKCKCTGIEEKDEKEIWEQEATESLEQSL